MNFGYTMINNTTLIPFLNSNSLSDSYTLSAWVLVGSVATTPCQQRCQCHWWPPPCWHFPLPSSVPEPFLASSVLVRLPAIPSAMLTPVSGLVFLTVEVVTTKTTSSMTIVIRSVKRSCRFDSCRACFWLFELSISCKISENQRILIGFEISALSTQTNCFSSQTSNLVVGFMVSLLPGLPPSTWPNFCSLPAVPSLLVKASSTWILTGFAALGTRARGLEDSRVEGPGRPATTSAKVLTDLRLFVDLRVRWLVAYEFDCILFVIFAYKFDFVRFIFFVVGRLILPSYGLWPSLSIHII